MRRGRRIITLKYAATCADCGAKLEPGDRARYYGRGRVYGVDCHSRSTSAESSADRAEAAMARRERAHMDAEYAKGVADVEKYHADRDLYGQDVADQMAAAAEYHRYWVLGED